MNNFVGIDISLNSTAICIENKRGMSILSFTSKKDNNIYIKELSRAGVKFYHTYRESSKDYSDNEILKLKHFEEVSKEMVVRIIENLDPGAKTICNIEGYSFSKNTSSILDIVSLSTLIKNKLLTGIPDIEMSIISPSSLKLETCKLVYPPINIGKKKEKLKWVNDQGISGGSFKKPQMFKAMLDGKIDSLISQFLFDYRELSEREKIPNPIEDIIDSIFACKIMIRDSNYTRG